MRKFVLVLLCLLINAGGAPAYALAVTPTPDTEFLPSAPLMITGYQTAATGQNLAAVELYNAGDAPVNLQQWALSLTLKDGSTQPVAGTTTYAGLFLPGEHVVYSAAGTTTYGFTVAAMTSPIVSITMNYTGSDMAYKPVAATVKDQSDLPFFRTYTSTGYSTATQPFASTPARAFYDDGLYQAPNDAGGLQIVEVYPYSSDCAPNDTSVLCGDYIKLENTGATAIMLDNYALRTDSSSATRTASNTFTLAGTLQPGEYKVVDMTDAGQKLSLTNSGGYVWLEDTWGMQRYDATITKYKSAGTGEQGYAYALASDATWQWTTTPEPTGQNVITQPVVVVAECPEGKYRSPDTGRCRTIEEVVNALSTCEEGYERNPTTNRCRKITTTSAAASLTPCLEGQERNPATNRCRSIATAVAELMPCDEGYERNPATNRCRKVASADMPNAAFPVTPTATAATDTAGWIAFGIVSTIAVGYGVWEWRVEIAALARRFVGIFARSK